MWLKFAQENNSLNIFIPNVLKKILLDIKNNNGVGYLVGGIVRDAIINQINNNKIKSKDYDVEVFHIPYDILINILSKYVM